MEKRVFLAIFLSFIVLVVYQSYFAPKTPVPQTPPAGVSASGRVRCGFGVPKRAPPSVGIRPVECDQAVNTRAPVKGGCPAREPGPEARITSPA